MKDIDSSYLFQILIRKQFYAHAYVAVQLGIRYTARMSAKKRLPNIDDRDLMRRAIDLSAKVQERAG